MKPVITTTIPDIGKVKPMNNWLVIETTHDVYDDMRELASGIVIDTTFEPDENAVVTGTVIALTNKLRYINPITDRPRLETSRQPEAYLEYDVDMELEKGDFVYYKYLVVGCCKAGTDGFVIWCETTEKYYLMVRYDRIYAIHRGDKFIPINGYIIFKKIKKEKAVTVSGLEIQSDEKWKPKQGVVVSASSLCREYYSDGAFAGKGKGSEPYRDVGFCQEGDVIHTDFAIPIGNQYLRDRTGEDEMYVCHENMIKGKEKDGEFVPGANRVVIERMFQANRIGSANLEIPESQREKNKVPVGKVISVGEIAQKDSGAVVGGTAFLRDNTVEDIEINGGTVSIGRMEELLMCTEEELKTNRLNNLSYEEA